MVVCCRELSYYYVMHWQVITSGPEETEAIAEKLGRQLRGSEVIELVSDLGGGKTTFVHGLAKGFGSTDHVASPTFTISKLYKAGSKEMYHFDFYRLQEAGIMSHEIHDLLGDPDVVIVAEWAEPVHRVLPPDRLTIEFKQKGDTSRELIFTYPESLKYLMKELC